MSPGIEIIRVSLADRGYEIHIGSEWLAELGSVLLERFPACRFFLITDSNLSGTLIPRVTNQWQLGDRLQTFVVPAGEFSKSVAEALRLWESLLAAGADREAVILALGGGVIGDLAGFVAANFARGLRLVHIPTSLLAQVDSSVGGKVAVNLADCKNIIGCIWQPALVAIDVSLLATLPQREYLSGLAEVVKYGVILDADFFQYLERHWPEIVDRDPACLARIVTQSCQFKARVVAEDERDETGRRAILNYGHTFGHAVEVVAGYGRLLHGEAVAMGMHGAARLAQRLGWVCPAFVERQAQLLHRFKLPTEFPQVDCGAMLDAMKRDKKVKQDRIRFILPRDLGEVEFCDMATREDIQWILSERD